MAGPLTGLSIMDFSTLLPGPYATMMLADLGADVLRIVSRSRPDLVVTMPPMISNTDISANAGWLGRGKKSLFLNLKDQRAITIVHQLIKEYDIIVEQFRPGVMTKLGLGYEDLHKIHPSLIYCSVTGYGQTGPISRKAGHDINYLSRSGLMSYSGRKDVGPSLTGLQIADLAAGSQNAIIGILAAVIHRTRTGQGQHVDISMLDGMVAFNAMRAAAFLVDGEEPKREGELLNGGSFYDFYETKDGNYISFGGLEPQFFTAFCRAIDCLDLIEPGVMPENIAEAKTRVRKIIETKTRKEWEEVFNGVDACVEPVLTLSESLDDPQIRARGMVVDVRLPGGSGTVRQLACPIKFSESIPAYDEIGSAPGVDTLEILRDLGYTEKEIAEFGRTGVFG